MILTGPDIIAERERGRLVLEPFHSAQVQPNSYDLTLGPTLAYYTGEVLDTRAENPYVEVEIPKNGFVLEPHRVYLGSSVEVLGSNHYVPRISSRSGAARLGLFSHCTAELIDIGSIGQTTFQFHSVKPLRVHVGDRLGQVAFFRVQGDIVLYDGKYQGSRGPQPSKIHLDAARAAA
ncbi:deoxycytidine triphosphate deaminase [Streptomyces filipinensis]|uniref:Deoxycytidine triphosphate deaminase n=1 Tax=Streptomyces filipinensis TaxID=66887 RepID=A0A918IK52_9ACTN|nr:dCTP deaminase [Streptomyces filipinensis]GGV28980.1 deoxycytidine triphosphate deaminase [Streptomyces filipinensis]